MVVVVGCVWRHESRVILAVRAFALPGHLGLNMVFVSPTGADSRRSRSFAAAAGGVLADEMGLGKTVQVCSLLNGARKVAGSRAKI